MKALYTNGVQGTRWTFQMLGLITYRERRWAADNADQSLIRADLLNENTDGVVKNNRLPGMLR
jgi:hypothetical protein